MRRNEPYEPGCDDCPAAANRRGALFGLYPDGGDDAQAWHVDPDEVQRRGKPNRFLLAGPEAATFEISPARLSAEIEAVALQSPDTILLNGTAEEGRMTFVTRSRVMKYPDYTTFKIVAGEEDGTSLLSVFARSRYGHRDFGVNRKRVDAWLLAVKERNSL